MKKFLPYIVIILLLGIVIAWFALHKSAGTVDKEEGAFAVEDKNEIQKIVLADTDKKKIELTKVGGVWMVNGSFPARDEMIASLLEAVTRVTSLCPVPNAAHDNVIREMLAKNVRVDIYKTNSEKPVKTYYVGGPTVTGDGTYMLLENDGAMARRPHITYLPGLGHGYLSPRFNTDEETWRNKVLFNYTADEIKSIEMEYPAAEQNSFIVNRVGKDSFSLSPKEEKYAIAETYRQNYLKQFNSFFSNISFEAYDNHYAKKDSMMHTTPYCILTITEKDNSVNKVNIYYMPVSERSKTQFDTKGNEMTYDIDHYHASVHGGKDFVIIQYYVFGKMFRSYKDFFFKPQTLVK